MRENAVCSEITFYTLLALTKDIGANKIAERIEHISKGRVIMKSGTLHTLIMRLEMLDLIYETGQINEKTRSYKVTDLGIKKILEHYDGLIQSVSDASRVISELLSAEIIDDD